MTGTFRMWDVSSLLPGEEGLKTQPSYGYNTDNASPGAKVTLGIY